MQIEMTIDHVAAFMSRMPAEAISSRSGIAYEAGALHVPGQWEDAALGVLAVEGWETAPAPVLTPITRRQLRLTLLAHGLLELVEPAIASLDNPERSIAVIEWQDASEYRRDHALIAQIGAALALTEPEIDSMWVEAMAR